MKFFRSIVSVVPGPLVTWLNAWLAPLSDTAFTHPHWQVLASNTAFGFGTIEAAIIVLVWRDTPRKTLSSRALLFFSMGIALAAVSLGFYFFLGHIASQRNIVEVTKTLWMLVYIFMLLSLVAAITFAVLGATARR